MDASIKLAVIFQRQSDMTKPIKDIDGILGRVNNVFKGITQQIGSIANAGNFMIFKGANKMLNDLKENEDAVTQLRNTMMDSRGDVSGFFGQISKKAEELGKTLPGTSADFYNIASILKGLGVNNSSLTSSLEASAKMATVLKPMGVTFEQAAEGIGKFKNALGIADADMVKFTDTIQRTAHEGVSMTEMQYAFARMAMPLKQMGMQGISAAESLTPLVAMLIKTGKTGETVGTSLGKIFQVGYTKGAFSDIKGMFEYLKKTDTAGLQNMFGKGGDDLAVAQYLKKNGEAVYGEMQGRMASQASLDMRIKNSMSSLSNIIEAMFGALNKLSVTFGKLFGPSIKSAADYIGGLADKISELIDAFPVASSVLATFLMLAAKVYVLVKVSVGLHSIFNAVKAVIVALKGATSAQLIFNSVTAAHPYVKIAMMLMMAVAMINQMSYALDHATNKQRLFNQINDEAAQRISDEKVELELLFDKLKSSNTAQEERKRIADELVAKYPDLLKGMRLENMTATELTNTYNDLATAIEAKARAEVAKEIYKKAIQAKMEKEAEDKARYNDYQNSGILGKAMIGAKYYLWDNPANQLTSNTNSGNQSRVDAALAAVRETDSQATKQNAPMSAPITINWNGQVLVSGDSSQESKDKLAKVMKVSSQELADIILQKQQDNQRGAYAN